MAKKTTRKGGKRGGRPARVSYFAYGSNLSVDQMVRRVRGVLQGPVAYLRDHRLAFAGWSGRWGGAPATVRPSDGECVPGVLYSLTVDQLRTLDGYEGVESGCYSRIDVTVHDDRGKAHRAITYVRDHGEIETPPSVAYVATIRRGCMDHGIETGPLNRAVADAYAPRVVFVYGSLLSGFGNHRLLDVPGAAFVGEAETEGGWTLHDLGAYPGMVRRDDLPGESVRGELYAVDREVLRRLDQLEGHPRYYTRTEITLDGGEVVESYTLDREQVAHCSRVGGGDWRAYTGADEPTDFETEWTDYSEIEGFEDDGPQTDFGFARPAPSAAAEPVRTPASPLLSDAERDDFNRRS